MPELNEAELTKAAYSYFTLDEWKTIAGALRGRLLVKELPLPAQIKILELLTKLPSAAL